MTCQQLYQTIQKSLLQAGVEAAATEAFWLLEDLCGINRTKVLSFPQMLVDEKDCQHLMQAVQKRCSGYPLQYILGKWEFYGLPFYVGEGVLIPRSDTESVVELALECLKEKEQATILDLCTGSGCIAITLASLIPDSQVWAVELEQAAFEYLQKNIQLNHVNHVHAVHADALRQDIWQEKRFDLIVSNPPYIDPACKNSLSKEVGFEPDSALFAPEKGLYFYRELICRYTSLLKQNGVLLFEIGHDQYEAVKKMLLQTGCFKNILQKKDLGGHIRAIGGQI